MSKLSHFKQWYLAQDIPAFVMYCVYGESGSLLRTYSLPTLRCLPPPYIYMCTDIHNTYLTCCPSWQVPYQGDSHSIGLGSEVFLPVYLHWHAQHGPGLGVCRGPERQRDVGIATQDWTIRSQEVLNSFLNPKTRQTLAYRLQVSLEEELSLTCSKLQRTTKITWTT